MIINGFKILQRYPRKLLLYFNLTSFVTSSIRRSLYPTRLCLLYLFIIQNLSILFVPWHNTFSIINDSRFPDNLIFRISFCQIHLSAVAFYFYRFLQIRYTTAPTGRIRYPVFLNIVILFFLVAPYISGYRFFSSRSHCLNSSCIFLSHPILM